MNEFLKLDPHMRSLALVGSFLQHWALVESNLNRILIKSIGLDNITGLIVVKNIQFRDKIRISISAIRQSFILNEDLANYQKLMKSINDFSAKRNIIAHELFVDNDDGDVEFLVTKANDGLKFPKEVWSIDTFLIHFNTMNGFIEELKVLHSKLTQATLVKALISAQNSEPVAGLGSLGILNALNLDPPSETDSGQAPNTPSQID